MAQLWRSALEAEGIAAIVRGEDLTSLHGEIPAGAAAEYRVCIVDDDQLPRTRHLVRQWLAPAGADAAGAWVCGGCGERHEPQFGSCWRCGAEAG